MVQHVDSGARLPKFQSFLSGYAIVLPGPISILPYRFVSCKMKRTLGVKITAVTVCSVL